MGARGAWDRAPGGRRTKAAIVPSFQGSVRAAHGSRRRRRVGVLSRGDVILSSHCPLPAHRRSARPCHGWLRPDGRGMLERSPTSMLQARGGGSDERARAGTVEPERRMPGRIAASLWIGSRGGRRPRRRDPTVCGAGDRLGRRAGHCWAPLPRWRGGVGAGQARTAAASAAAIRGSCPGRALVNQRPLLPTSAVPGVHGRCHRGVLPANALMSRSTTRSLAPPIRIRCSRHRRGATSTRRLWPSIAVASSTASRALRFPPRRR